MRRSHASRAGRAPFALLAPLVPVAVSAAATLALALVASPARTDSTRASSSVRVYESGLSHRPGWYPPSDPESMSVITGRRDAPAVDMRFSGGRRSAEELARAVLRALEAERDDSLTALCITWKEFEVILWPEFPESRPVTGLTATDGWRVLGNRLASGSRGAIGDLGGGRYELVSAGASAGVTHYRNFDLHRGFTIVVTDSTGAHRRLDFIRSIAERKGTFKIYSMED